MQIRFPVVAAVCAALPAVASAQCAWEPIGEPAIDGTVAAIAEFEGEIYVAGNIFSALGVPDSVGIIRWNGTEWESVGGSAGGAVGTVLTLTVIDGALWAGGRFDSMGGVPGTGRVAKWDGDTWSSVGGGLIDGTVLDIVEFDGEVYVGGYQADFGSGDMSVVRWDGTEWSQVGAAFDDFVRDLIVFDDGSGPTLFAGGGFLGLSNVARWNGEFWATVGGGMTGSLNGVHDFEIFDGSLYASGDFETAGGRPETRGIARWDGAAWRSVGGGATSGPGSDVRSMEVFDDGTGPAMFVVGSLLASAGGVPVSNFAKWDGAAWSAPEGGGLDDDGSVITSIDGTLCAGGRFVSAGGTTALRIARWSCESAACYADLDGDGELTLFDFLAFQNAFDASDMVADCDGDGDLTLFDFLCFQNAFDAGCP